jgi:hypothetical protein
MEDLHLNVYKTKSTENQQQNQHRTRTLTMTFTIKLKLTHTLLVGLVASALCLPSWAGSASVFSASDSASTSVASLSESLQGASNSVSKTTRLVQGDYLIQDMQVVMKKGDAPINTHTEIGTNTDSNPPQGRPQVRLTLRALQGPQDSVELTLPLATTEQAGLWVGQTLQAKNRPYGVVLSNPLPFFILLDDRTLNDLSTRAVAL